ncbi:MAG: T9SS type A sorting domain-containing protein, partial [Bacteroidales bacterium]|nr:T9SS type A sorting domain-containing protein [Bacteroidales bacterium]
FFKANPDGSGHKLYITDGTEANTTEITLEGTDLSNLQSAKVSDSIIYISYKDGDYHDTYAYNHFAKTSSLQHVDLTQVSIHPIPMTNELNISNAHNINKIVVSNISGQTVIDIAKRGINSIDVSSLESGIYLVTLYAIDGSNITYKVIK